MKQKMFDYVAHACSLKGPGERVSPIGNHGAFFPCDLYTRWSHLAKFQFINSNKQYFLSQTPGLGPIKE